MEQAEANKIVKHEWLQVLVMTVTVAGLFLWCRSESRADYRHLDAKTSSFLEAIHREMKDFHGKLERQDAEFRCQMARQDAEYKAGLLLLEEKMRR